MSGAGMFRVSSGTDKLMYQVCQCNDASLRGCLQLPVSAYA